MGHYDIAVILRIHADTYETAVRDAVSTASDLASAYGMTDHEACVAIVDYEHDNDGQRVVYLHPEGVDALEDEN